MKLAMASQFSSLTRQLVLRSPHRDPRDMWTQPNIEWRTFSMTFPFCFCPGLLSWSSRPCQERTLNSQRRHQRALYLQQDAVQEDSLCFGASWILLFSRPSTVSRSHSFPEVVYLLTVYATPGTPCSRSAPLACTHSFDRGRCPCPTQCTRQSRCEALASTSSICISRS